jgi:hypothetical protein
VRSSGSRERRRKPETPTAAEVYERFARQWSGSESDSPELREARDFASETEDQQTEKAC